MTRNRRIKAATREYQAATCTSYTAARRVVTGTDSAPTRRHAFAWIPPSAGHAITLEDAAAVAMEWAEQQAVGGLPAVLVTDLKGEYAHGPPTPGTPDVTSRPGPLGSPSSLERSSRTTRRTPRLSWR
jgi:hypothetical protein